MASASGILVPLLAFVPYLAFVAVVVGISTASRPIIMIVGRTTLPADRAGSLISVAALGVTQAPIFLLPVRATCRDRSHTSAIGVRLIAV